MPVNKEAQSNPTYSRIGAFEGRVLFIHLEIDLACGDGKRPAGHQYGGYQLGGGAHEHRACNTHSITEPILPLTLLVVLNYASFNALNIYIYIIFGFKQGLKTCSQEFNKIIIIIIIFHSAGYILFVRHECAFNRSVLSQWRVHQPDTGMRITCSAPAKQLLGFLGWDEVMLASLPIEQSCPATHCPRHTAQMSGRGLAAGGIPSVMAGHTHTPLRTMCILGKIQGSSCFKCPVGVIPQPYDH